MNPAKLLAILALVLLPAGLSGCADPSFCTETDGRATRIAVIGDSISSRNGGASTEDWPTLLGELINSMGVSDVTVKNYSLPGLTYRAAFAPTESAQQVGGRWSTVEAVKRAGTDVVIICLGVNDRQNSGAAQDLIELQAALPASRMILAMELVHAAETSVVTEDEQAAMAAAYAAWQGEKITLDLAALYSLGYTYDGLHPTNSGKQWIAATVYRYLQSSLEMTPVGRDIEWLKGQTLEDQAALVNANN